MLNRVEKLVLSARLASVKLTVKQISQVSSQMGQSFTTGIKDTKTGEATKNDVKKAAGQFLDKDVSKALAEGWNLRVTLDVIGKACPLYAAYDAIRAEAIKSAKGLTESTEEPECENEENLTGENAPV